jgi:hypothetical protein
LLPLSFSRRPLVLYCGLCPIIARQQASEPLSPNGLKAGHGLPAAWLGTSIRRTTQLYNRPGCGAPDKLVAVLL